MNNFLLSSLSYQNVKFSFYSTRFHAIKCDELAEPIAATCARAHSARLYRRQVDGKLNLFVRLEIELSLPSQKADTSTTRPTERWVQFKLDNAMLLFYWPFIIKYVLSLNCFVWWRKTFIWLHYKQNTITHPYRPFHPLEGSSGKPKPTQ